MNNEESKKLCYDLLKASNADEVVDLLRKKNYWDDESVWNDYGDNPDNFATVNNQGDSLFALTEKVTNSIDAVLMGKCFENGIDPKDLERAPNSILEAISLFIEKDGFKFKKLFKDLLEPRNDREKDKVKGMQLYWDNKFSLKVAENIAITATGDHDRHPNIAISDLGEGQTPENLGQTILSLHKANKKNISFTQGKWNQGGTGAILHCGTDSGHQVSLVISKRNPKILEKFNHLKTALADNWSFTIIRRYKPKSDKPNSASKLVYLAPNKFENDQRNYPLYFSSKTFPIFNTFQNGKDMPFTKEVEFGTCINLYEYKVNTGHVGFSKDKGLYRKIELQMPKLPLPVRLWEAREHHYSDKSQSYSIKGFCNVHDLDKFSEKNQNLELIEPDRDLMTVESYQIEYQIFCFKKGGVYKNYKGNHGVLWCVNGQTHAIQTNSFFNSEKLAFDKIKSDLLIIIDCTGITGADREDVFKSSRDRLNVDNKIVQEIKKRLIEQLSENQGLLRVIEERVKDSAKNDPEEDEELIKDMSDLLSELEDKDRDLLPTGLKLKRKKEIESGSGKEKLKLKEFPTFFEFRELKGKENQILNKDIEFGSKLNLSLITDAVDNYLSRRNKKGNFKIEQIIEGESIKLRSYNGPSLNNGVCKISNITTKKKYNVGDLLQIKVSIHDNFENKKGFHLYVNFSIRPKQEKIKRKKIKEGGNKKQTGNQGIKTEEVPSLKPIVAMPLSKDDWFSTTDQEWHEELVTYIEKNPIRNEDGNHQYKLYYNKDNINLIKEFKNANHNNPIELIEKKWQLSLSLIAMYALMQYRKDKTNNLLEKIDIDDASKPLTIEETAAIKIATKSISRGIFQLPEYISKLGK